MFVNGQNVITVSAAGREHSSETIHFAGMRSNQQVIMVESSGRTMKRYNIRHQRISAVEKEWRSLHLENVGIRGDGLQIRSIGGLDDFEISGLKNNSHFNLSLHQYKDKKLKKRVVGRQSVSAGRTARYALQDWNKLSSTKISKKFYTWPSR